MEKMRFLCRVEHIVKDHAVLNEIPLGDHVVLVQCLGCGIMGVELKENAK